MSLFIGGALVATVVVFVFLPLFVFKPRLDDLAAQRDEWRERALHAEDGPYAQVEQQYRVTGQFAHPVAGDDWLSP